MSANCFIFCETSSPRLATGASPLDSLGDQVPWVITRKLKFLARHCICRCIKIMVTNTKYTSLIRFVLHLHDRRNSDSDILDWSVLLSTNTALTNYVFLKKINSDGDKPVLWSL